MFFDFLWLRRIILDGEFVESDADPDYSVGHCHFHADRQFARVARAGHTQR